MITIKLEEKMALQVMACAYSRLEMKINYFSNQIRLSFSYM